MPIRIGTIRIAHKLSFSALAFAIPIAFILWSLLSAQNVDIDFASAEVLGARYLGAIAPIQARLAVAAVEGSGVPREAAASLTALDISLSGLDTRAQSMDAVEAVRAASAPAAITAARAKLRDLITRVGDRSNLILDNVLATYYLTDVVLNRLPDALDRLTDLELAQRSGGADVDSRAQFLLSLGGLVGDLDGMDGSLASAEQAAGGEHIKTTLGTEYQALRKGLTATVEDLKADRARVDSGHRQLMEVSRFSQSAATELTWLLEARVAQLHAAQRQVLGVTAALFVAATVGMLWTVRRGVIRPLARMTGAMAGLADGHLDAEVPGRGRKDEIGEMAQAVEVFKQNALRARALEHEQSHAREQRAAEDAGIRERAEHAASTEASTLVVGSIGAGLERLAERDLTYRVTTALPTDYEPLRGNLNSATETMHAAIGEIICSTQSIRISAGEVSQAADDLSRRTEQQAASLEEAAAALDQITATVKQTAGNATAARDAIVTATKNAEHAGAVVTDAVAAMGEIERSSQQIGQIIGVIDEIAFQTSLLALNAGVEAARAGDAGRGFAVVASEVRGLAQRSAEAAKEIKVLVSTSSKHITSGVKLVHETGTELHRIVEQVAGVVDTITQIAAASHEQAGGLAEVNIAVNEMDKVTQQNAAMVEQSTAASRALLGETEKLTRLSGRFQLRNDDGGKTGLAAPPRRVATPARTKSQLHLPAVAGGARNATGVTASAVVLAEGWEEF